MSKDQVFKVIENERAYQDQVWGGNNHDKAHTVGDWIVYMNHYLDRAKIKHSTAFRSDKEALTELRKVVALGIACFEQFGVPERESNIDQISNNPLTNS